MKWELFVDESGDFERDKPCLVGGFLCPEGVMNEKIASSWKFDVMHDPKVAEAIDNFGKWNFDHCCENICHTNRKTVNRGILQTTVLDVYCRKLEEVGGRLVIFDAPDGTYNIDNTTNFLTVLSKGLLMLFYDLQEDMTSLKVHFASRRNNTRQEAPEALAVSPTRVQEPGMSDKGTILPEQYALQLKNLAFLQGGQWLLNNDIFSRMLETIDIIGDRYNHVEYDTHYSLRNGTFVFLPEGGGDYERVPNPLTIPCDYICNTFYKGKTNGFAEEQNKVASTRGLYSSTHCLYYQVDRPIQNYVKSNLLENGATGDALLQLISMEFPEPETARYFRLFNANGIAQQRAAIDGIVSGLYPQVDKQHYMPLLISRLEHAVEVMSNIDNESLRCYVIANLYLYMQSLYTHLGKQQEAERMHNEVHGLLDYIEDDSDRDKLIDIADNRHLVDLTDLFAYEDATREFEKIKDYWKKEIDLRRRRTAKQSRYAVYGKAIGSYLQLLRHRMHETFDPEEKELFYMEATELFDQYLYHVGTDAGAQSRCHQTLCDIEAEIGHYDQAIEYLYKASLPLGGNMADEALSNSDKGKVILQSCGTDGAINPYLLQHYVRTVVLMESCGAREQAECLALPYLTALSDNVGAAIGQPHPRIQVEWKTASILAYREKGSPEECRRAAELFEDAIKQLLDQKTAIFSAIAVGVAAEYAYHVSGKRVPGNVSVIKKRVQTAYKRFLNLKPGISPDPFEDFFGKDGELITTGNEEEIYKTISSKIGY